MSLARSRTRTRSPNIVTSSVRRASPNAESRSTRRAMPFSLRSRRRRQLCRLRRVSTKRCRPGVCAYGQASIRVHRCLRTKDTWDYDVHRAARIAGAAHGGQIVISTSTAALIESGVELTDLGDHRFKDLAAAERVYQLGRSRFPPLKSLFRTNLPIPANPLVGRKKEVLDVYRLLGNDTRLITITGPGGVGKTRFALAAASEASDRFPDGVWFVDLSPVRDPALVGPTIGRAIGADDDVAHHLRDMTTLLVIDNFEQVVAAARDLSLLLDACPNLQVLTTSREPLRISHEKEYALDPLLEAPAVELFRHRAAAVAPDVAVEYALAAEICLQLDRLPLAIELAAARSKVFRPRCSSRGSNVDCLSSFRELATSPIASARSTLRSPGATSSSTRTRHETFARSRCFVAVRRWTRSKRSPGRTRTSSSHSLTRACFAVAAIASSCSKPFGSSHSTSSSGRTSRRRCASARRVLPRARRGCKPQRREAPRRGTAP